MKLACQRCKSKKIKCNKGEPTCNHCMVAKAECEYIGRRQRARAVQQKTVVHRLSQRLESLERSLSSVNSTQATQQGQSSLSERHPSTESGVVLPAEEVGSRAVPDASLAAENGQESWIYRMATDVQRNFQSQVIPDSPLAGIDDAMLSLNEALQNLGRLRVRNSDDARFGDDLGLSTSDAARCVDAFIDLASNMILPDLDLGFLDIHVLRALPGVFHSPYVNIEPVMKVLYWNAIHYGLQEVRGFKDPLVQTAYLKFLEAVPGWLESSSENVIDGYTAGLSTWTTLTNHDYQLAWKFHCKTCQYIKMNKIDNLDILPARSFQEENARNNFRYLYFHVLCTDMTFRLFFGKPTVVRWVPDKIRPPQFFSADNMFLTSKHAMVLVVWVQYTLLSAETINFVDKTPVESRDEAFHQKIDEQCARLEGILLDWRLEADLYAEHTVPKARAVMADHLMNVYAMIMGINRLVKPPTGTHRVDEVTLRAARKVVKVILDLGRNTAPDATRFFAVHFISFYPFCAVFSLYEHIITSTDPEECEKDAVALEEIGIMMSQVSTTRTPFVTLERTINALNKVARAVQNERRQRHAATTPSAESTRIQPPTFDNFQDFASSIPNFDVSTLESFGDFSTEPWASGGGFHPMGFVRAVETDFVGRDWNEHWWDPGYQV